METSIGLMRVIVRLMPIRNARNIGLVMGIFFCIEYLVIVLIWVIIVNLLDDIDFQF